MLDPKTPEIEPRKHSCSLRAAYTEDIPIAAVLQLPRLSGAAEIKNQYSDVANMARPARRGPCRSGGGIE